MALGIGTVQETLVETNRLLTAVLDELQRTNDVRLDSIAAELRDLNQRLGGGTSE